MVSNLLLSVWGQESIYVLIIAIFVLRGMFLKGMDDRFLLSKDQRLNPNIDKAMSVNVSILKKASKLVTGMPA